ncbi:hypothetical protein LOC68_08905 [Blastopirellula sp. JC732]|uniref:Uncharacterized protein n=1 Tax=Blastopirellula sediminis TaxID=2894196 RepID=A0A9X1SFN3_9BACT|nr:hypothetical protein [Blastopirellula sediminis]MCC9608710.1 hypothetical protein [Blastopirellula sediminis]MCC9628513.1 hypothetical protein [Blastopirellula sediminis]
MYDESDLEIVDPLEHIRERPEMYLAGGDTSATALANRLLLDLQTMPGALVICQQIGDWTILGSDRNWTEDVAEPREVFERVVSYRRNDQTGFHAEVLLAALASNIALFAGDGFESIQGDAKVPTEVLEFPSRYPELVRCIAFTREQS